MGTTCCKLAPAQMCTAGDEALGRAAGKDMCTDGTLVSTTAKCASFTCTAEEFGNADTTCCINPELCSVAVDKAEAEQKRKDDMAVDASTGVTVAPMLAVMGLVAPHGPPFLSSLLVLRRVHIITRLKM